MKLRVCKRCTILSFTRIIYFGCGRQVELHLSWRIICVWLSALSSPTSWPNVINLTINARHLIISRNSALVCIHIQNIRKLHRAARGGAQMNIHSITSRAAILSHINTNCDDAHHQKPVQTNSADCAWKLDRTVCCEERRKESTIYGRFMAAYSRTHIQMDSAARGIKS